MLMTRHRFVVQSPTTFFDFPRFSVARIWPDASRSELLILVRSLAHEIVLRCYSSPHQKIAGQSRKSEQRENVFSE